MKNKLKQGFTLVELVVVMILIGLVMTAVVMVLMPTSELAVDIDNKSSAETSSITLFDYINGTLRYATGIEVVSNNDPNTVPEHGSTQDKFILLCNEKRDTSKKNASGYAENGDASTGSSSACVSESLLGENNFEFTIAGYNNESGSQSLTIAAEVHPMTTDGSDFYVNTNKVYNFSETFQLLNLQKTLSSTTTVGSINMNKYDASCTCHWIFYISPESANNLSSTATPVSGSVIASPSTANKGTKKIDLGVQKKSLTLHFMRGDYSTRTSYKYSSTNISTINDEWGLSKNSSDNFDCYSSDVTRTFYFNSDTASVTIEDNSSGGWSETITYSNLSETTNELWVYDWGTHDAAFAEIGTKVTIHYRAYLGSMYDGIAIKDSDGIASSVKIDGSFYDESTYTYSDSNGSKNIDVYLREEGSSVTLYWGTGCSMISRILNKGDASLPTDIYIGADGITYADDGSDIPTVSDGLLESNQTFTVTYPSYNVTYNSAKIEVMNSGTETCNVWSMTLVLPEGYTYSGVSTSDYRISASLSGNVVTLTSKDDQYNYCSIPAGESTTFTLSFYSNAELVVNPTVTCTGVTFVK